jgi:hypothetical protein
MHGGARRKRNAVANHKPWEAVMRMKAIVFTIPVILASCIGCYSSNVISKEEFLSQSEQTDITVFTKDSSEYEFSKDQYRIAGDSLSGLAMLTKPNAFGPEGFKGSIAIADIAQVEREEFSTARTVLLVGGIGLAAAAIIVVVVASQPTISGGGGLGINLR